MMLMRTTMTIDNDVFEKLQKRIKESGKPAKDIYNELLRSALLKPKIPQSQKKYKVRTFAGKSGLQTGFTWDLSNAEILNQLDEAEFFKK